MQQLTPASVIRDVWRWLCGYRELAILNTIYSSFTTCCCAVSLPERVRMAAATAAFTWINRLGCFCYRSCSSLRALAERLPLPRQLYADQPVRLFLLPPAARACELWRAIAASTAALRGSTGSTVSVTAACSKFAGFGASDCCFDGGFTWVNRLGCFCYRFCSGLRALAGNCRFHGSLYAGLYPCCCLHFAADFPYGSIELAPLTRLACGNHWRYCQVFHLL